MNQIKPPHGFLDIYLRWPLYLTPLWIVGTVVNFMISPKAGIISMFFTAVFVLMAGYLYTTRKKRLLAALFDYTSDSAQMQSELLREMPSAYCLVDADGDILWRNRAFLEIQRMDVSQSTTLLTMFPNVKKEMLQDESAVLEIHSEFADRKYCLDLLRTSISRETKARTETAKNILSLLSEDTKVTAVYLRDETEELALKKDLEDEHSVLGLIYIDNYEEVLEQIEEVRQSLLVALVDRKINRYISSFHGMTKKLEKDRYFFLLKQRDLIKLLEDRFSILDEVRQVNIGNELSVTLSIGLGYGAREFSQNYDYARTSIDMALGRGGDQAVVKSQENLNYFGGKSKSTEKTTRVKARVKAQAFQELLENKETVLIMGHTNADMDCLGSSVGVYRMASSLGKKAHIVQTKVTSTILPLKDRFQTSEEYPKDMFITGPEARDKMDGNTVLVIVDTNRPSILDEPELLRMSQTTVVFDHHRQAAEQVEGAALSYCEPFASSASEMIAEMMQYFMDGIKARPLEADCLYGGLVIDTQEFTNQTGVRTFEAAAYLRRCGADIVRIRKTFRENFSDYQAKALAISSAEVYRNAFAFARVSARGSASATVLAAQTANELLDIRGIKASIALTEVQDIIYISARSIDEMNVQVLMEKLGGGGHRTIAGAQLRESNMEEAIATIKTAIDQMISEGEVAS